MVNMICSKLLNLRQQYSNNASILLNYLFVGYAFSIPLSASLTNAIFTVIIIVYLLTQNVKETILKGFKNNFVQSVTLFYFLHIIWILVDSNAFAIESIKNLRFLLYSILYLAIIKKEFIFRILNGFLFAMMFSEIVSYLIFFDIIIPINNATIYSPIPFVLSHSQYAVYLGISMGIMLYMSFNLKISTLIRAIYIIFFITASINIFIISSRLGFILYAINIIFVMSFIFRNNIFKAFFVGLPLIFIGYIMAYNFSVTFKDRTSTAYNSAIKVINDGNYNTSLGIRIGYWLYSYDIIMDNIVFGTGNGNHIIKVKENIQKNEKDQANINSLFHSMQDGLHSDSLDILTKFGIIGFLIYLNIFYQLYKYIPIDSIFRVVQILLIVSFLVSGLQGGTLILKDLGKLFTLLGVLSVVNSVKK